MGQDCKLEIKDSNIPSDYQDIWINGFKVYSTVLVRSIGKSFNYKDNFYIPVNVFNVGMGEEIEQCLVFSCKRNKLVARFVTQIIIHGYENDQDYIKFKKNWTPDFNKMILRDQDNNQIIPMTLDKEPGFFPGQKLNVEKEEEYLPPPPPKK